MAEAPDLNSNYAYVVNDQGIYFRSNVPVSHEAVRRARYIVNQMLSHQPIFRERMIKAGFAVDIIGINQVVSDLPHYTSYRDKKTMDGRDVDTGVRGFGDSQVCSVGEENLLCLPVQKYPSENILVHEFAHSIMQSMDKEELLKIYAAFDNAVSSNLYQPNQYMLANVDEYWAEGVQAWFNASTRIDVNNGINTREKIQIHDFMLTLLLKEYFGLTEIYKSPGCSY